MILLCAEYIYCELHTKYVVLTSTALTISAMGKILLANIWRK